FRKHFSEHDVRIRDRLDDRIELEERAKRDRYEQLQRIVAQGLRVMQAGLAEPEPRDMVNAIKVQQHLDGNGVDLRQKAEQARWEFELFVDCVKQVTARFAREHGVPDAADAITHAYRERMAIHLAEERAE